MSKVWFITGTSRGFGREWARAALERGDRVAGTARDLDTLDDVAARYAETFLPLWLDVSDRDADFAAVRRAAEHFGRLDVVVNNAGYGHFGTIEELTEAEVRAQFDTNLFGALWVTQAALPIMRKQGSGHILQVSSIDGVIAYPGIGAYDATKWALEGLSQSLAAEMAPFGVHVTLIEPGGFNTDWLRGSSSHSTELPQYAEFWKAEWARRAQVKRGTPSSSASSVLKLVDAENPPLRAFLGHKPLGRVEAEYAAKLETWRAWQDNAVAAHRGGD